MIEGALRRRLVRGIGANLYGRVVVAFVQLAGVPILLHCWGIKLYGEWLILFALPSYLSMTDLGFSISAGNDMTAKVARGLRAEALVVFQSISLLITISSLTVLAIAVSLILILPVGNWLHIGALPPFYIRFILVILCMDVLLKLFDGINHAGFRSNGEFALHTTITNTTPLLQQMTVWAVALSGHGPVYAVVGYFLVRLVMVPGTYLFLFKRHRWLKFGFAQARAAELKRLLAPALGNIAIPFAQALSLQGMVLVVASALGPVSVVVFSTLRTLTRLTLQLVATISNAAEPEFAGLDIDGTPDSLVRLYIQTIRLSLWIAGTAVIILACFGKEIIGLWTHGRILLNAGLFYWLLGTVVSQALWYGALSMLKSRNKHTNAAAVQMATSISCLFIAAILLRSTHDITYAGLALFVSDVTFMIYTMQNVRQSLGVPVIASLFAAMDPRPLATLIRRTRHA
jgi:O-antigen/teichoic acid export membrane protein